MNWENITDDYDHENTQRLKVPGGWLYRSSEVMADTWKSHGMVFVHDPDAPRPIFLCGACNRHQVPSLGFKSTNAPPCPICTETPA